MRLLPVSVSKCIYETEVKIEVRLVPFSRRCTHTHTHTTESLLTPSISGKRYSICLTHTAYVRDIKGGMEFQQLCKSLTYWIKTFMNILSLEGLEAQWGDWNSACQQCLTVCCSGEDADLCSELLQESLDALRALPEASLFDESTVSSVWLEVVERATRFLRSVVTG